MSRIFKTPSDGHYFFGYYDKSPLNFFSDKLLACKANFIDKFPSEEDILEMIALRNKAREDKNYKEADIIRNRLLDKGVLIEDKDGKTIWKLK